MEQLQLFADKQERGTCEKPCMWLEKVGGAFYCYLQREFAPQCKRRKGK